MNQNVRNALLFVVIVVSVILLWNWITTTRAAMQELGFSEFLDKVEKGEIVEVLISGDDLYIRSSAAPPPKRYIL